MPFSSWEIPWLLWNIYTLPAVGDLAVSGVPVQHSLVYCAFAHLVQMVTKGWSVGLCMKLVAE